MSLHVLHYNVYLNMEQQMSTDILDLQKVVLDLNKKFELNLEKAGIDPDLKLQTRLAIDASGSMDRLYDHGWVDHAVDLFLAAALKFDDNGELEVSTFGETFKVGIPATIDDAGRYVQNNPVELEGETNIAPVVEKFAARLVKPSVAASVFLKLKSLFGITSEPADQSAERVYLGIITDGQPTDLPELEDALQSSNPADVFIHFICIGNSNMQRVFKPIAEKYSHVECSFFHDPTLVTTDQFYSQIVNSKFSTWSKQ